MSEKQLAKAIGNGQFIVTVEYHLPHGTDIGELRTCAAAIGGLAHGVCPVEGENGIRLSGLAACSHLASAGAEPVLPLLTRDMNRIALQSTLIGAASLGITNILCLSGRHQTVTGSASARGVYDIDPIQLLRIADDLRKHGRLADGKEIGGRVDLTLGTDANPFAEPSDLHLMTLEKAVAAGADYVVTQPVFDIERFESWMVSVRERGIDEKICIIASVIPLTSAEEARSTAETRGHLSVPGEITKKLCNSPDQRATGMQIAVETSARLRSTKGVRGINIVTGADYRTAADVLKAGGLSRS
ncbi:MAG TPA: methylenetetrahydrofolate reductase [Geobacteraceae bacterium]|nr:methylenetetrahydrofolate reductase [Geobacteraceae bacterium]